MRAIIDQTHAHHGRDGSVVLVLVGVKSRRGSPSERGRAAFCAAFAWKGGKPPSPSYSNWVRILLDDVQPQWIRRTTLRWRVDHSYTHLPADGRTFTWI
jgi:hypothetical protein